MLAKWRRKRPESAAGADVGAELRAALAVANEASSQVSNLHIAIMAACAYLLVTTFATTPMDLLVGRGIKLPIIGVEIPVVSFYVIAPILVVLLHFNFLLQLQLLSRKLFAFDALAPRDADIRVRLHGFHCTQYLVGNSRPIVRSCVGVVVVFTVLFLPLLTLIGMQIRFLAYQDDVIAWAHRICIWVDAILCGVFWPLTVARDDRWRTFASNRWQEIRRWPFVTLVLVALAIAGALALMQLEFVLFVVCLMYCVAFLLLLMVGWLSRRVFPSGVQRRWCAAVLILCAIGSMVSAATWFSEVLAGGFVPPEAVAGLVMFAVVAILGLSSIWVWRARFGARGEPVEHATRVPIYHGVAGLFAALFLAIVVPASLRIDWVGRDCENVIEAGCWDVPPVSGPFWLSLVASPSDWRIFAPGTVVSASPVSAPTAQLLHDTLAKDEDVTRAVTAVEPIDLARRSLGRGVFDGSAFPRANLEGSRLDHASFVEANLIGANLSRTSLVGANFTRARLTGQLPVFHARLDGATLRKTRFSAVNLDGANLRRAIATDVIFGGASLRGASLMGGLFTAVSFEGSRMSNADLRAATFDEAQFEDADLRQSDFSGASAREANFRGADIRGATFMGVDLRRSDFQSATMKGAKFDLVDLRGTNIRLADAMEASFGTCIVDEDSNLPCATKLRPTVNQAAETYRVPLWRHALCDERLPYSYSVGIRRQLENGLLKDWPEGRRTLAGVVEACFRDAREWREVGRTHARVLIWHGTDLAQVAPDIPAYRPAAYVANDATGPAGSH